MKRLLTLLFIAVGIFTASCQPCVEADLTGCPIKIDNAFSNPQYDHGEVVNVLLLPVDNPLNLVDFELHYDEIVQSLQRNFGKFHYFNLQYDHYFNEVSGPVINLDTGFFDRLKLGATGEEYNVQAVLKVTVNEYRAFPPMRMRVKAALIDVETGERIWSFDHVFDADDASVVNDLRAFWNSNIAGGDTNRNRFHLATVRPSVFNNYVFYRMARSYSQTRVENVVAIQQQAMEEEAFTDEWEQMQQHPIGCSCEICSQKREKEREGAGYPGYLP